MNDIITYKFVSVSKTGIPICPTILRKRSDGITWEDLCKNVIK